MMKMDQEVFTRILNDNPVYVISALRTWAYARNQGEPSIEDQEVHPLHVHPYFVFEDLAQGCAHELNLGGQHIPAFLRELADSVEQGQLAELRKLVAEHGPKILGGMGARLEELYANPPMKLVYSKELTEEFRALLRGTDDAVAPE